MFLIFYVNDFCERFNLSPSLFHPCKDQQIILQFLNIEKKNLT